MKIPTCLHIYRWCNIIIGKRTGICRNDGLLDSYIHDKIQNVGNDTISSIHCRKFAIDLRHGMCYAEVILKYFKWPWQPWSIYYDSIWLLLPFVVWYYVLYIKHFLSLCIKPFQSRNSRVESTRGCRGVNRQDSCNNRKMQANNSGNIFE